MIRIAVVMDKACVMGASSSEGQELRVGLLPNGLPIALENLLQAENIAGGESSWLEPTKKAEKSRYVITRNEDFDTRGEDVFVITNPHLLIERYEYSDDELLIAGGLSMFNLFIPHTQRLQIALVESPLPGDLVFDSWKKHPFELQSTEEWVGFNVLTYRGLNPEEVTEFIG